MILARPPPLSTIEQHLDEWISPNKLTEGK